jgi:hypothetical protein
LPFSCAKSYGCRSASSSSLNSKREFLSVVGAAPKMALRQSILMIYIFFLSSSLKRQVEVGDERGRELSSRRGRCRRSLEVCLVSLLVSTARKDGRESVSVREANSLNTCRRLAEFARFVSEDFQNRHGLKIKAKIPHSSEPRARRTRTRGGLECVHPGGGGARPRSPPTCAFRC